MKMQELTTERETITGTVPYQVRPFIYVNRRLRVRLLGYPVQPRSLALALLLLVAGVVAAMRLLLAGRE